MAGVGQLWRQLRREIEMASAKPGGSLGSMELERARDFRPEDPMRVFTIRDNKRSPLRTVEGRTSGHGCRCIVDAVIHWDLAVTSEYLL